MKDVERIADAIIRDNIRREKSQLKLYKAIAGISTTLLVIVVLFAF